MVLTILFPLHTFRAAHSHGSVKMSRLEDVKIPEAMDYFSLKSISSESKEKLTKIKPATIGQASRISGVSPSDISVLLITLGR